MVVATGGQVRVLDRNGATRATADGTGVLGAAVLGDRVPLLHRDRIDLLGPDGGVLGTVQLAAPADADSSFGAVLRTAMYVSGGRVHAVHLGDGRDRVVARVPAGRVEGSGLVRAAIGADGIVYARSVGCRAPGDCRGEVHLVTNAAIARAFARPAS